MPSTVKHIKRSKDQKIALDNKLSFDKYVENICHKARKN